jgi:hypothetical protein
MFKKSLTKEVAAKEKLEIVLSAVVQGEAGGRDDHEQIAAGQKQNFAAHPFSDTCLQ